MEESLSQLLNVTKIHTGTPFVPELIAFDVEMVTEKFHTYISPGTDLIPAQLIQAGCRTMDSESHKLTNPIWNKEEQPQLWKELITLPSCKQGDREIVPICKAHHCYQLHPRYGYLPCQYYSTQ